MENNVVKVMLYDKEIGMLYWEEYLSGLTVIEPYTSAEGFTVSNITIVENRQHDFRLDAIINGKRYGIRANHRSELATEIRSQGYTLGENR